MRARLAKNLAAVPSSTLGAIWARSVELEQAGRNIHHFEIGRPDFDTPEPIKKAASRALARGEVHYTVPRGIPVLREAIARDAETRLGLAVDPDREVMVTIGAVEALTCLCQSLLDPGDEILVPAPAYPLYKGWAELLGARTVFVPSRPENDFALEEATLRAHIGPRTKLLVVNTPSNPTGRILGEDTLAMLARVAREKDLLVLSDEVYDRLVYPPAQHRSIAALPGMKERTIVLNSFSKGFAMDGWRIGYCLAPDWLIAAMDEPHLLASTCAPAHVQAAAAEALRLGDELVEPMRARLMARRDLLLAMVEADPHLSCAPPQGAFYLWLGHGPVKASPEELPMRLLEEAGVALLGGPDFGPGHEGYLRLSYASPRPYLEAGMKKLIAGLDRLR